MIKSLKLAYEFFNFFHKRELKHNIELYNKYGLRKKYFSSISSEDFRKIDLQRFKMDLILPKMEETKIFKSFDEETKKSILSFDQLGYCVLSKYLSSEKVDQVNNEIDHLLKSKQIRFKYRNKLMFAIHKSKTIRDIFLKADFEEILNVLIKGKAELFQSINFLSGSEQKTHSDSIHMTTFPLGGLLGVWIALEDINEDNGPIHYYPGSHKLPYYMNRDYDNLGTKYLLGNKGYGAYETMINQKVKEQNIPKEVFKAKKGDVFIWHANLLHGGEKHLNKSKSRKSMVLHYFDKNRICYHEITQRPALIKKHLD